MRRSWLRSFWVGLIVVGAAAGYLVSSGLGERLLHSEIETQLARLLQGPVEIAEVKVRWNGGLRLEARELAAFPGVDASKPPAIRARRLVAWIDVLALLIGRLELSTLVLEGPFLRVEQNSDGGFSDLPLPSIEVGPIDDNEDTLSEAVIARIEGLDESAERLFESIRAADRIEILDGTIHWIRQEAAEDDEEETASELRFELFSTVIERHWLSEDLSLEWSAVVVDGQHAPFPIGAVIERASEATDFDWTVTMSQIPLEAAKTPLAFIERIDGLSGQLTTVVHLGTRPNGSRRLTIDGQVHDAIVDLRRSNSRMHREQVTIHAEIDISPKRVRLVDARLEGETLGIDLKGSLERPIRPKSKARVESRMVGVELEDIFELAESLEDESTTANSFSRLVERVEGGRILYVETAGTAQLRRWQDLISGRVRELPDGFVLGCAFEDITIATGPEDKIEGLHGKLEWVEDQITFRDTSATFRGGPLPLLNVVLDGASHLARTPAAEKRVSTRPPPVPGLMPLLDLIKPRDPTALPPVKAIGLAVEHLEHPLFRFPFKDLRVLIEPQRSGMDIQIRGGTWGGATTTGEVRLAGESDAPEVTAHLILEPGPPIEQDEVALTAQPSEQPSITPKTTTVAEEGWGKGRFELDIRPGPQLPFKKATGFFRLVGSRIVANEIQLEIESVGQMASRIVLDLEKADRVGVDLTFALTDGRLEHVGEFIGLPPGFATGGLRGSGSLRGSVRPDESLIAKLDGNARLEATDGRINTKVPLLLRLSRASEGYNPFANEDELQYESMSTTIGFQQGSLFSEDFEIEGPLRVYARGRIDPLAEPSQTRGVVGIFLFRAPNQILESLPLVKFFLPGSERGLIGAYFDVKGALAEPSVEPLTVDTLMTLVPPAIKAPFKVLQYLFEPSGNDS